MLRQVPLFSSLSQRELAAVARVVDEISVDDGRVLTAEGQPGEEFCLIVSGSATVRRGTRRIATLGPGEFFGEMALLDNHPRSATVVAAEPSVLLVMRAKEFSKLLDTMPSLTRKLLVGVSQRLREANRKLI